MQPQNCAPFLSEKNRTPSFVSAGGGGHVVPTVGMLKWEVAGKLGQEVTGRPLLQLQMTMGP